MRCEVVASLLHQPSIVFLDEPTIGLDASAKKEIREFLRQVNEVDDTTVILTTHDMKDIESLCDRVMLIDKGQLIYDGSIDRLKRSTLREKTLRFHAKSIRDPKAFAALQAQAVKTKRSEDGESWTLNMDDVVLSDVVRGLLECCEILDLNMTEPELEDVVDHIYGAGVGHL
jgi:ABC-2 type transport system ATP-binding protein